MKTLQFTAQCDNKAELQDCKIAQNYVADLLARQLNQHGFETLPQSGAQIAVSVEDHPLPLSVSCESRDAEGRLVCEILSYPEEEQDWFDRIESQSLLNQLAQAVGQPLKQDENFTAFEWKN